MWLSVLVACGPLVHGPVPKDEGDTAVGLTLVRLEPSSGPVEGGLAVGAYGTGFTDATTVTIAGVPCASLSFISDDQLTCVTPPNPAGDAEFVVTEGGASVFLPYTYVEASDTDTDTDTDADTDTDTGRDTDTDTATDDTADTDTDPGDTGDTADTDTGDTAVASVPIDYCHLQYPCEQTVVAHATSDVVYGWIYQAGVTEGAGEGAGLLVEVGVGLDGTNPATAPSWSWSPMTYNLDKDGLSTGDLANDEYAGTFEAPGGAGAYDYCVRASADGGASWTYCDGGGESCPGDGSDDGYTAVDAGALTVP